ncbi:MAG: hypothetical protein LBD23_17535 [Oscillospiraceae bacterium]|jgi:hypothetical protein|nr:hypothetical protein [Oscillospiraceae bacterium]
MTIIITKVIWIIAVLTALAGVFWFLYLLLFERNKIGPAGPVILGIVWIPTIVFIIISIIFIIKNKIPISINKQIILIIFLLIFSFIFSVTLLREPSAVKERQKVEERNRQWREENTEMSME